MEARRQIILVNHFIAKPAQLILALESVAHDLVIKPRKILLTDRRRR
jgi:hypothetical protein